MKTHREKHDWYDTDRGGSGVAASQGMPGISGGHQKLRGKGMFVSRDFRHDPADILMLNF